MRKRPERHALTIELTTAYGGGTVLSVVSVKGREHTLSRLFGSEGSPRLSTSQAFDLQLWLCQTLTNWLVTTQGVQEELLGPIHPPEVYERPRGD